MLWMIAAAMLLEPASAPPPRVQPDRQARASVVILRAEVIRLGEASNREASVLRSSTIRDRDGSVRASSLVEFY